MPSLNKVFLMGNLTRDPELRYTPSGSAICAFGLAINRQWTTPEGEKKEDVCFVECQMWGRCGEVISEYLKKGDPISTVGPRATPAACSALPASPRARAQLWGQALH